MLRREIIERIFKTTLVSGDFTEIFFEEKDIFSLTLSTQKIEKVLYGSDFGVGIRILDGYIWLRARIERIIRVYKDSRERSLLFLII